LDGIGTWPISHETTYPNPNSNPYPKPNPNPNLTLTLTLKWALQYGRGITK